MAPKRLCKGEIIRALQRSFQRAALLVLLCAVAAPAQGPPPPSQPMYTLHVYNNLVQFATIVLDEDRQPPQPIPRDKFAITLDGGPVFHPTQMRREGDDPIELAVLLDAGGSQNELLAGFADAFTSLMPAFLRSNDRISIYAEDCTLVRSLRNVRADADTVRAGIASALKAPMLHGVKRKSACGSQLKQWDNIAMISADLASQAERRVILMLSDGEEDKSKTGFRDVSNFTSSRGTAVFLMHDISGSVSISGTTSYRMPGLRSDAGTIDMLCHASGGMTLNATPRNLAKKLQEFVMLLRERYIIEFPRPDDRIGGQHEITIDVPGKRYFIRNTGAITPLSDPSLTSDPNTLPTTASPAKLGTRRPLN